MDGHEAVRLLGAQLPRDGRIGHGVGCSPAGAPPRLFAQGDAGGGRPMGCRGQIGRLGHGRQRRLAPPPPHRSEGIGNEGGGTLAVQVVAGAHLLQKRGDGESDDDDADDGHPDEQDGGDGRPEEREPHPGERRAHIAAVGHERDAVEQGGRSCAGRRREQGDDAEQRHEDEREAQRDAQRHALRLHAVQNGAANGDEEEGHDVAAHAEDDVERLREEVGHDGSGRSRGRDEQHDAQNDEADAHDVAARAVVQDAGLDLHGAAAGRGGFARAAFRQVPRGLLGARLLFVGARIARHGASRPPAGSRRPWGAAWCAPREARAARRGRPCAVLSRLRPWKGTCAGRWPRCSRPRGPDSSRRRR